MSYESSFWNNRKSNFDRVCGKDRQSGHFDYDANLDEFYDYEGYALQRMNNENGMFTDRGYIAYNEYWDIEEIMNGSQGNSMEMSGLV